MPQIPANRWQSSSCALSTGTGYHQYSPKRDGMRESEFMLATVSIDYPSVLAKGPSSPRSSSVHVDGMEAPRWVVRLCWYAFPENAVTSRPVLGFRFARPFSPNSAQSCFRHRPVWVFPIRFVCARNCFPIACFSAFRPGGKEKLEQQQRKGPSEALITKSDQRDPVTHRGEGNARE